MTDHANGSTPRIPIDYHMHSRQSCDSRATMAEMAQAALDRGIGEIAFTEHFDRKPEDACFDEFDAAEYFVELAETRAAFAERGLTLRAGIEVGEMHLYRDEVQPVLDAHPFDLVLGSMHWTRGESVFYGGFFRQRSVEDVVRTYFTEQAEMAQGGGFDVLSHLDVFKRYGFRVWGHFDISEWEGCVRPVWEACLASGIIPEINTSALRMAVQQTHPTLEALRWYRDMGGEHLVIGSDSHRPDHVGSGLETAIAIAQEAGFTHLCRFERRAIVEEIPLAEMPQTTE